MNNVKSVFSPFNVAMIGVDIVGGGLIGYASAAIFTTINPVFGAIHGLTFVLSTDITKVALNFFKNIPEETKKIIAQGVGIGVATTVSVFALGLSPWATLALGISQVALALLLGLAVIGVGLGCVACCPSLAEKVFGKPEKSEEDVRGELADMLEETQDTLVDNMPYTQAQSVMQPEPVKV
jgi:hypothetical protein